MKKTTIGKTAYAYLRAKATEDGSFPLSICIQYSDIVAYCKTHNIQLIDILVDYPASGADIKRPMLEKLIGKTLTSKVDYVIVADLSRLSRNTLNYLAILDVLKNHDVKIITINNPPEYDSPISKIIDELMLVMNSFSPRIKATKKTTGNQR